VESTKQHMRCPAMDDGIYMPIQVMPMMRPMPLPMRGMQICPKGNESHMEMYCMNMYMSAICEA
jgi:hypothetical protein